VTPSVFPIILNSGRGPVDGPLHLVLTPPRCCPRFPRLRCSGVVALSTKKPVGPATPSTKRRGRYGKNHFAGLADQGNKEERWREPLRDVKLGKGGLPRLPLTDEQWSKTATLSGISADNSDARRDIEILLGEFRLRQSQAIEISDKKPAPKIRAEFEALAKDARNLHGRLSRLMENQDAYEAITLSHPERLSTTLGMLGRLPKWLVIAAHNLEKRRRGPQAGNVYWLIGNLGEIRRQYTGVRITRSYKDDASKKYIEYVCKIADPKIGAGTIDLAMKVMIKATRVE
jgi:hypothetical protein